MSYNLVERDKDDYGCQATMGVIEFLRRVHRKEPLPNPVRVSGLDDVLGVADDTSQTATVMRNLLAERSEYMARQRTFVVFPLRGSLEESGGPKLYLPNKTVDLRHMFGNRLDRTTRHMFVAKCNLTRAQQSSLTDRTSM